MWYKTKKVTDDGATVWGVVSNFLKTDTGITVYPLTGGPSKFAFSDLNTEPYRDTFSGPFYDSDSSDQPILQQCIDGCKGRGVLDVDIDAVCAAGTEQEGTQVTAIDTYPWVEASCTAVDCPSLSTGDSVETGCTCDDGYSGTIIATDVAPFYSGSCEEEVSTPCPSYSTGDSVQVGCTCEDGYTGEIVAADVAPFYSGSCTEDYENSAALPLVSVIWLVGPLLTRKMFS